MPATLALFVWQSTLICWWKNEKPEVNSWELTMLVLTNQHMTCLFQVLLIERKTYVTSNKTHFIRCLYSISGTSPISRHVHANKLYSVISVICATMSCQLHGHGESAIYRWEAMMWLVANCPLVHVSDSCLCQYSSALAANPSPLPGQGFMATLALYWLLSKKI